MPVGQGEGRIHSFDVLIGHAAHVDANKDVYRKQPAHKCIVAISRTLANKNMRIFLKEMHISDDHSNKTTFVSDRFKSGPTEV